MLTAEVKQAAMQPYQKAPQDSGSTEVQIALLTVRIRDLQLHFKEHPKDLHSLRGMMKLVANRRKLLKYLMKKDLAGYRNITTELEIRN